MGEKKNPWLIQFEAAGETKKLDIIWRVAHFETINSLNRDALHAMLKYLADLTIVPIEEVGDDANP